MGDIPDDIRRAIAEATHKLKTETGVCHACKETHRLGNLYPIFRTDYLVCYECNQKGDERLMRMIAEEMGWANPDEKKLSTSAES